MAISFYDVSVGSYLQALPGACATLDKAKAHFETASVDRETVLLDALAQDMKPLRFQIQSVVHHSLGAIEGLRTGAFAPPAAPPARDWDGWRDHVAAAADTIAGIGRDEIEALGARDVLFSAGGRQRHFTAEEFILSFSLPNLYFHAATAYDILRLKGVPLQKLDYLGRLRGRSPKA